MLEEYEHFKMEISAIKAGTASRNETVLMAPDTTKGI
jgi:hypothetical protein